MSSIASIQDTNGVVYTIKDSRLDDLVVTGSNSSGGSLALKESTNTYNLIYLFGDEYGGKSIFRDLTGNARVTLGINESNSGYIYLRDQNGNILVSLNGNGVAKVKEIQTTQGYSVSGFSITKGTNCKSASIKAYRDSATCFVNVSLTSSASVANSSSITATVTYPTGYTPIDIDINSSAFYNGRAVIGKLNQSSGTVTFRNCGSSNIPTDTSISMTFIYLIGG